MELIASIITKVFKILESNIDVGHDLGIFVTQIEEQIERVTDSTLPHLDSESKALNN